MAENKVEQTPETSAPASSAQTEPEDLKLKATLAKIDKELAEKLAKIDKKYKADVENINKPQETPGATPTVVAANTATVKFKKEKAPIHKKHPQSGNQSKNIQDALIDMGIEDLMASAHETEAAAKAAVTASQGAHDAASHAAGYGSYALPPTEIKGEQFAGTGMKNEPQGADKHKQANTEERRQRNFRKIFGAELAEIGIKSMQPGNQPPQNEELNVATRSPENTDLHKLKKGADTSTSAREAHHITKAPKDTETKKPASEKNNSYNCADQPSRHKDITASTARKNSVDSKREPK